MSHHHIYIYDDVTYNRKQIRISQKREEKNRKQKEKKRKERQKHLPAGVQRESDICV